MHRALATAIVTLATSTAWAHPGSVSYADFSVDARSVHGVVRLPLDDVDLLLRIDRDLDGQVSATEIDAANGAITAYIARHLRIVVDAASRAAVVERVGVWRDPMAFYYLEAELTYPMPRGAARLVIQSDFLTELYSSHQTIGRVTAGGRQDRVTFRTGAAYERRLAPSRLASVAMVVGGAAILALLWVARRRTAAAAAAMTLVATAAHADIIMSAPQLNATLKTMDRLTRAASSSAAHDHDEALFQLGAEADSLASIMNLEVESHGMQERELLDLALSRTKELGVAIAYNRDKKKFFYDGAAFADYLKAAPRGAHAAVAEFKLLSYQFYQSPATDTAALTAAADAKKRFLARYPRFDANAEVRLYLAVDYRDLYRRQQEAKDPSAERFRRLARAECNRIERMYPRTEQADAARQLSRGLR
jgi:hypothetical protein